MGDEMIQQEQSWQAQRSVCAAICQGNGLKAKEIARQLNMDRGTVNRILYSSPLLKELCWQDDEYRWHGIIQQSRPHRGLYEFSGYYGLVSDFLALSEEEWMRQLAAGCRSIGRNLNDKRGLLHSFRDCRATMLALFYDLREMVGPQCMDWELVFELRIKRSRHIRIYADVLVITQDRVFSLEFKMKDAVDPEEVRQAAKYCPYLEILFGPEYEVIPALVLTTGRERFEFVPLGEGDQLLPVCSGDMLFNVFDEYMGFLNGW